ncbi:MAG: epoxyqueuosine reductase [Candidatus Wallbacteria bacterium]|nr:epoxyqueuosine reductase [Candidatus Wallbacteria bacterium]
MSIDKLRPCTFKEKSALGLRIKSDLKAQGADFVHFVDISPLPHEQRRNLQSAILIGLVLSREFLRKVVNTPEYVKNLIHTGGFAGDEYLNKEHAADALGDQLADQLTALGYAACSQSEARNEAEGRYDQSAKSSLLPHKTIAGLAGLGWIGRNNLLVTESFGCAFCLCSVLTDAPLETVSHAPQASQCGNCRICLEICPVHAIKGKPWSADTSRDELVDVHKCTTCLECMVFCRFTQKYME